MKVAVLLGGTSAERDVSLVTGISVSRALHRLGHQVLAIDCAYGAKQIQLDEISESHLIRETPADFTERRVELDRNIFQTLEFIIQEKVDAVFIALHGGYGENGQLQAMLEVAHIPFAGSNSLSSAICMDKHISKLLVQANGIRTASWIRLQPNEPVPQERLSAMGFPIVIKPVDQGSTVGLSLVRQMSDLQAALTEAFRYSSAVIAEKYIAGRELTVSILGDRPLPVIEIIPQSGLYDYESKYQPGRTRYEVPASLPQAVTEEVQHCALEAFRVLGCRHYGRVDFRLSEQGKTFFLEVNTLPGMTPTSLVPKAAAAVGMDFNQLINALIKMAVE